MLEKKIPIKFNTISNVDYKRPIPPHNDMRTSYYFGHRLIYDNDIKLRGRDIEDKDMIPSKRPLEWSPQSEMQVSFMSKYPEPTTKMSPLSLQKLKCIKGFDETALRFAPRPIKDHLTTYKLSYTPKQRAPDVNPLLENAGLQTKVNKATYSVRAEKPGYTKYLDMMAPSHALDFMPFSQEQLSTLASRDAITFWTWNDIVKSDTVKEVHPAFITAFAQSKDVIPPRNAPKTRSIPSLVKSVPNRGLITENQARYAYPDDPLKFKAGLQEPVNLVEQIRFTQPITEYSMIGSKNRIQRYV